MDLNAKSLSMIALVAATERMFGIKTTPAETAKNTTVKKAVDYIMKKLGPAKKVAKKKTTKKRRKK
jgi:acyl carrier protein